LPFLSCCLPALALALVSHPVKAQCASSTNANFFNCQNPASGCFSSAVQNLPNFGEYGIVYVASSVSCCGQSYPNFIPGGGTCNGSGKVADPMVRQKLIELAKFEDIMVSSCHGEYRPLEIALAEPPESKPSGSLELKQRRATLPGVGRGGQ
jgi:hypothetical protein